MTALMLAPAAADAEELEVGARTVVYWTENAQGVSGEGEDDPDDDFSVRVTPSILVRDPDGELTWSLRYQPSYERFLEQSEISGFDHAVAADLSWKFAERWTFTLRENYVLNQSTVRFNEAAAPGEDVTLDFRDQEVRTNRTTASLAHVLSPRDTLSLSLGYNTVEYPDGGRAERTTPSLGLAYNHIFSERTTAGLVFSWIQQSNEANQGGGNDETFFYNLSGTLRYLFSPTFRLEASAGPTLIDSAPPDEFEFFQFGLSNIRVDLDPSEEGQDIHGPFALDAELCEFDEVPGQASVRSFAGCSFPLAPIEDGQLPTEVTVEEFELLAQSIQTLATIDEQGRPLDTSDSELDLTYFARLALMKDWEYWSGSLGYVRSNSETARFGSSSVADTFWLALTWKPDQRWSVNLSAAYSLQEQASDVRQPFAFRLVNVPAPAGVTSVTQVAQIESLVFSKSGSEFGFETQSVALSANRRLSRHASAFVALNWYAQEQDSSFRGGAIEGDNLSVSVGLNWTFDPIRF